MKNKEFIKSVILEFARGNMRKINYPKLNNKELITFGDWLYFFIKIYNSNYSVEKKKENIKKISELLAKYLFDNKVAKINYELDFKNNNYYFTAINYRSKRLMLKLFVHISFPENDKLDNDYFKFKKGSSSNIKIPLEGHIYINDKNGAYMIKLGFNTDLSKLKSKLLRYL